MSYDSSIPPPPTAPSAPSTGTNANVYRMKQPFIEPVRISSASILPGKPGLLSPISAAKSKPTPSPPAPVTAATTHSVCPVAAVEAVRQGLRAQGGGRVILLTASNASKGAAGFFATLCTCHYLIPCSITHAWLYLLHRPLGFGRTTRAPQPSDYGTEREFPFYASLEASNETFPRSGSDTSGNASPSSGSCSGGAHHSTVGVDGTVYMLPSQKGASELDAYLELKKDLLETNICLEVFFFVPSLNSNTTSRPNSPQKVDNNTVHCICPF